MGDTHEFKVYPKDSSGAIFPLAQYSSVEFTIAERRGTPVDGDTPTLQGHAEFSADRTHVSCAITPEDSDELDPTKSYVFDVRISKTGVPYDSVFTLLTGNISIQNRVEPFETLCDNTKIKNNLTWEPTISVKEWLKKRIR